MRKAEIAQYSRWFRVVEILSIILASVSFFISTYSLFSTSSNIEPWLNLAATLFCIFLGCISADFVAGFVHWAADTWGNQSWPIVGPTLIRSFREHHVDAKSITRHDFIEVNGATALVLLPVLAVLQFLTRFADWHFSVYFGLVFGLSFSFFIIMTNQFHKWSHQTEVPLPIQKLMDSNLILSKKHHAQHHRGDHTSHYCITTGWLNSYLEQVHFFRRVETVVSKITRLVPREDDQRLLKAAGEALSCFNNLPRQNTGTLDSISNGR
jgi:plasmanylethanolamine desaturase